MKNKKNKRLIKHHKRWHIRDNSYKHFSRNIYVSIKTRITSLEYKNLRFYFYFFYLSVFMVSYTLKSWINNGTFISLRERCRVFVEKVRKIYCKTFQDNILQKTAWNPRQYIAKDSYETSLLLSSVLQIFINITIFTHYSKTFLEI